MRRKCLSFVEDDHAFHNIVELAALRWFITKDAFEKLDGGRHDERRRPILAGEPQPNSFQSLPLFSVFRELKGTVMFQHRVLAQYFAVNLGRLIDYAGVGESDYHTLKAVHTSMLKSKGQSTKGLPSPGGNSQAEESRRLFRSFETGFIHLLTHLQDDWIRLWAFRFTLFKEGHSSRLEALPKFPNRWPATSQPGSFRFEVGFGVEIICIYKGREEHPYEKFTTRGHPPCVRQSDSQRGYFCFYTTKEFKHDLESLRMFLQKLQEFLFQIPRIQKATVVPVNRQDNFLPSLV